MCVHGLTGSSRDFDYIGEYLGPLGYCVAAIDMPGRGKSDFLKDPLNYRFEEYFKDLAAFLTHLNLTTVNWLGVSMGGLLGIHLAGEKPELIKRMILSDIGPEVPKIALDFIRGYLTMSPAFSSIDDVVNAFKQGLNTPFSRGELNEEQWRHYASTHVRQNDKGLWIRSFDPAISVQFDDQPIGDENLWPYWEKITQPVLAFRGELSILLTEEIVTKMIERKPGHKLDVIRIAKAGHVPSLYTDEQIKMIEDWLKQPAV